MAFDARVQLANVAAVERQTQHMLAAMRTWPEANWQRPTYCPDWVAADAVAHLATGGEFYAQVIESGCAGDPKPAWGVQDRAEFRQVRGDAGRRLIEAGTGALIDGFETAAIKLQAVFERLGEVECSQNMAWHPRGLVPVGAWIGMRLSELAIHDWDMRQPHEPQAGLTPTALPGLVACLPEMQWQFLSQRLTPGLDGVHVLQAGDRAWAFRVAGDTLAYEAEAPTAFDTCVRTDAQCLILLTMGRDDLAAAQQRGALTLVGDEAQAQRVCETLFRAF